MPKNQKCIILGAGLAGLSAAHHLKKDYQIFEKEVSPGGLCRSRHIDGYIFDYDGHLTPHGNKVFADYVAENEAFQDVIRALGEGNAND